MKNAMLRRARFEAKSVRTTRSETGEAYKVKAIEESAWKDKSVRVVEEGLHEGIVGLVQTVRVRPNGTEILNCMTSGGMVFMVDASDVLVERAWAQPKPTHLNYRVFRKTERLAAGKDIAISQVEAIIPNRMLEDLTVEAALKEIEVRMKPDEGTVIVPPSMGKVLQRTSIEALGLAATEQERAWATRLADASHVYVVVHFAEHFVLVEAHKNGENWTIQYRDSSKHPREEHRNIAKKILENIEITAEIPNRCNRNEQPGGWECGIFAARWVERSLRELRGEGRVPPMTEKVWLARANQFIMQCKNEAAKEAEEKAAPKAKAKAKASVKPRTDIEPTWDTLEQALAAAHECRKCMPTLKGTKGCRACMGEWFEMIRQKGQKAREYKDLLESCPDLD